MPSENEYIMPVLEKTEQTISMNTLESILLHKTFRRSKLFKQMKNIVSIQKIQPDIT